MDTNNNGNVPDQMELAGMVPSMENPQLGVINSETFANGNVNQRPIVQAIEAPDSVTPTADSAANTFGIDPVLADFGEPTSGMFVAPFVSPLGASPGNSNRASGPFEPSCASSWRYIDSSSVSEVSLDSPIASSRIDDSNNFNAPLASGESSLDISAVIEKTLSLSETDQHPAAGSNLNFVHESSVSDETIRYTNITAITKNYATAVAMVSDHIDWNLGGNSATGADAITQEQRSILFDKFVRLLAIESSKDSSQVGYLIETNFPANLSATTNQVTPPQDGNGLSDHIDPPNPRPASSTCRNDDEEHFCDNKTVKIIAILLGIFLVVIYTVIVYGIKYGTF